jgi:GH15 family glucan-1,4-alpha-glucosidase
MEKFKNIDEEIEFHFEVIEKCCRPNRRGIPVLATFKKSRHPFFYPRDGHCICRALSLMCLNLKFSESAYEILRGIAKFTLSVQSKNGFWGQRYTLTGFDRSIYRQEDATAHGISILGIFLITSYKLKKRVKGEKKYIDAILRGFNFASENHFNKEQKLFYSTTSIHESSIEKGFTLWVNLSYWNAFNLAKELRKYSKNKKTMMKLVKFSNQLKKTIKFRFIHNGRFIARLDENLMPDLRVDIVLMAPFYFNFGSKTIERRTIDIVRKELWDKELGLLQRYLPKANNMSIHLHAGNGPWLQYSAILSQYYFSFKKNIEGNKILNLIRSYSSKRGHLPEHVSTNERFRDFIKNEWKTGIDFRKEFDKEILLPHIDFDKIVEELFYMKDTYEKIKNRMRKKERPFIIYALPLAWTHAEVMTALILKKKNEK